jgi:hypothetical protein
VNPAILRYNCVTLLLAQSPTLGAIKKKCSFCQKIIYVNGSFKVFYLIFWLKKNEHLILPHYLGILKQVKIYEKDKKSSGQKGTFAC